MYKKPTNGCFKKPTVDTVQQNDAQMSATGGPLLDAFDNINSR